MAYQPTNGDTVRVIRTPPGGTPRACCTGPIRFDGAFTADTGFSLDGCGSHASANALYRGHRVVQDIQPAD